MIISMDRKDPNASTEENVVSSVTGRTPKEECDERARSCGFRDAEAMDACDEFFKTDNAGSLW